MRLYEEKAIVPIISSDDIVSGATGDSILCKNVSHVAFVCVFGPSLSGNPIITIYEGATDGATTTAITFAYTYGGAATGSASSDDMATPSTSAALTCTGTTFVSRVLICEFDCESFTDGYDWLTFTVDSSASAGEMTVVAICEPKYKSPADWTMLS